MVVWFAVCMMRWGMLLDFVVRNFTDLGIPYTHGNFDQGFVHSDGGWGMSGTTHSAEVGG